MAAAAPLASYQNTVGTSASQARSKDIKVLALRDGWNQRNVTRTVKSRCGRQKGRLGPFAQQMALYSLAPIATQLVGNMWVNIVPGLGGQGGGTFKLLVNLRIVGRANHLPPDTYYQLPRPRQKVVWSSPRRNLSGVVVNEQRKEDPLKKEA